MAGSKPGERRGGRQKGVPNKRTFEAQLTGMPSPLPTRRQAVEEAVRDLRAYREGRPLAKEILEKYMLLFDRIAQDSEPPPPDQQWLVDPETGELQCDPDTGRPIAAKPHANEEVFWRYSTQACLVAKDLAKFQSPTFRSLVVSGDPDAPVQAVTRIERVFVNPPKHIDLDATDMTDDSFGSRPN